MRKPTTDIDKREVTTFIYWTLKKVQHYQVKISINATRTSSCLYPQTHKTEKKPAVNKKIKQFRQRALLITVTCKHVHFLKVTCSCNSTRCLISTITGNEIRSERRISERSSRWEGLCRPNAANGIMHPICERHREQTNASVLCWHRDSALDQAEMPVLAHKGERRPVTRPPHQYHLGITYASRMQ